MMKHTFAYPDRRAHAVTVNATRRRHRLEVIRWALANHRSIDRDALAVIIGTRPMAGDGGISTVWTDSDIGTFLVFECGRWCSSRGCALPDQVASTLATYIRYLSSHKLLDRRSSPVSVLNRAIGDYVEEGFADRAGRQNHPAERSRRLAPVLPIN